MSGGVMNRKLPVVIPQQSIPLVCPYGNAKALLDVQKVWRDFWVAMATNLPRA